MNIDQKGAAVEMPAPNSRSTGGGTQLLRRFAGDERGNIAILFGLCTFIVCAIVGGAVDYGRLISARYQTQAAVDSALLAAGRTAQTTYGNATASIKSAVAYYNSMKSPLIEPGTDSITFTANDTATTFSASGSAWIKTPFLQFACPQIMPGCQNNPFKHFPVLVLAGSDQAQSTIAQGGNSGTSVEVGLMLDTTGSMAGDKITDLKAAATDLVNIVVWDDQSSYTSRVAIAPFSQAVNVGDYFQAVTNQNPNKVTHTEQVQTGTTTSYVYPSTCYDSKGKLLSTCKNNSKYLVTTPVYSTQTVTDNYSRAKCVVERTGTAELTEDAPGPGTWLPSVYDIVYAKNIAANKTDAQASSTASSTSCPESVSMQPLTSDKTKLKATISSLVAVNSTSGAVGTAWAWYLISPNWGTIFTGDSQPASYSLLTETGASGLPKLQKIAILMTDGGYNYWQNASANVSSVNPKALALCSGMKAKGIKVYTVGFDLGSDTTAKTMLKSCATDSTYFYDAANGDALKAAFRDIALKISNLRLSH